MNRNFIIPALCASMVWGIAHSAELTGEYLHGEWCFTHMDVGGDKTEENRVWVFEPDGKFGMQQSSNSTRIKHSGYWKIEDGKLEIRPAYSGGAKAVEIVSDDNFVFKWMADLNLERGTCD